MSKVRALIVGEAGDEVASELRAQGMEITLAHARTEADSLAALESDTWDVVLWGGWAPWMSGPVALAVAKHRRMLAQIGLADRMAATGTLAAGVAHEINNPLAALTANLQLATAALNNIIGSVGLSSDLDAALAELSEARDGAERIRLVVRDLKMFSRSDEDRGRAVNVRRVLESALGVAWSEIEPRARLVQEMREVPPVDAGEGSLGHVFLNILLNAAQAIAPGNPEHNEIRVGTTVDDDGCAVVTVRDTGAGISEENLGRIFDPFFTTHRNGNRGLGLSISAQIVSSLGGTIQVESKVGRGSLFRVKLPPTGQSGRPAKADGRGGQRGRVLVVGEDAVLTRILGRTLASEHDVVVCPTLAEACLRMKTGERFDVIFCDVAGDGDPAETLRALPPSEVERTFLLVGGTVSGQAQGVLRGHCIEKPFETRQLLTLVSERLHDRQS